MSLTDKVTIMNPRLVITDGLEAGIIDAKHAATVMFDYLSDDELNDISYVEFDIERSDEPTTAIVHGMNDESIDTAYLIECMFEYVSERELTDIVRSEFSFMITDE